MGNRVLRDRDGVVHATYRRREYRYAKGKQLRRYLLCTNEDLYHLKTEKDEPITCLTCLVASYA